MSKTLLAAVLAIAVFCSLSACGFAPQSGNNLVASPAPAVAGQSERGSAPVAQPAMDPIKPPVQEPPGQAAAEPDSLLAKNTLVTIYGRAFGVAPILGHLGTYKNFEMMHDDIKRWTAPIDKENDSKGIVPAVHLIYAMATPCNTKAPDCLLYLDNNKRNDITKEYIEPAARRGWVVILDSQLGRSNPVAQVKRMIERGYLKYDNVHIAIDPEFHSYPGHNKPGTPIGIVQASEINEVQQILSEYMATQHLTSRKILIVHQFGDPNVDDGVPFMIQNKKILKTYPNVDLVINMDGLGKQAIKVHKYNKITDSEVYPFIKYRGIKIFYPNPWEKAGHFDKPPLSMEQVFGKAKTDKGPRMATKPNVVIIA